MRGSPSQWTDRNSIARPGARASPAGVAEPGKRTLVDGLGAPDAAGNAVDGAMAGAGAPLPGALRPRLEASLGKDLGGVRVHDDPASHAQAAGLGARAFTVGKDIHFAAGQLNPADRAGARLVAHEVAHTAQQDGQAGTPQAKRVSESAESAEVEADRFAAHIVDGGPLPALSPVAGVVQRQGDDHSKDHGGDPTYGDTAYDSQVTAIIQQLVAGYQRLHIDVPANVTGAGPALALVATVSTPYYNDKYVSYKSDKAADNANNPKPSDDFQPGARTAAQAKLTALAALAGASGLSAATDAQGAVWRGKGGPAELQTVVNLAVKNAAVVPEGNVNDATVWKTAIEKWMRTVGLGVDCNGLVYEALMHIRDGGIGAAGASKDYGGSAVNNILNAVRTDTNQDHRTLASIDLMGQLGIPITNPSDLRAGDVMVLGTEHVRIVEAVQGYDAASQTVTFTTAEATVDKRPATIDGVVEQRWRWMLAGEAQKLDAAGNPIGDAEVPVFRRHLVDPGASAKTGTNPKP